MNTQQEAFNLYCVGKDTNYRYFDANNGDLLIHMDDRRVSAYENNFCIDCNHEKFADGICTFASDYFPDHERENWTD